MDGRRINTINHSINKKVALKKIFKGFSCMNRHRGNIGVADR